MSELIAAISTPAVPSAIGVLRLSGPGAAECADKVFRAEEMPSPEYGCSLYFIYLKF